MTLSRVQLRWLLAVGALATSLMLAVWAMRLMTDSPRELAPWLWSLGASIPVVFVASLFQRSEKVAGAVLVRAIAAAVVIVLVVGVYIVLVVGINGRPEGAARHVMLWSMVAAVVAAILVPGVRARTLDLVEGLLHEERPTTSEAASTFGQRMSRAVPMDELMLQLAEALRETVPGSRAEIWTGSTERLTLAVSVPSRTAEPLSFSGAEASTVARARIGGPAWVSVWAPAAVPEEPHGDYRVVPVAHLGELLGLVVLVRPPNTAMFTDSDEAALVELAHQLGLALHNVELDSALQESLDALATRNKELQASRLRIVTASDAARRGIERNLHDGAQQHLVALAVKIGLISTIAEDGDPETVVAMLGQLRGDVQATIQEVRDLAHGIFPPLLRDRGLAEALRAAASRSSLDVAVRVDVPERYDEQVESAAYFCSLEAMQNAGKYAGEGASVIIEASVTDEVLTVAVSDDGAGFDMASFAPGHGFTNMEDRLGAIGGSVSVDSQPGQGTTVTLAIPARAAIAG